MLLLWGDSSIYDSISMAESLFSFVANESRDSILPAELWLSCDAIEFARIATATATFGGFDSVQLI